MNRVAVTYRFRSLVMLGLLAQALLAMPLAAGDEVQRVDRIRDAVVDALCFSVYWGGNFGYGGHFQRGVPVPFRLVMRGDAFYVWLKPIGFVGPRHDPAEAKLVGTDRGGRAVVVSNSAYEWETVFSEGTTIEGSVTIPRDCTPRYAPWSPLKERMVATVVSTMERGLNRLRGVGDRYPREVELVIADFNVEYPSTYVLVEPANQLFMLTLHDPQDYGSGQYERDGEYPFSYLVVKPHLAELLNKIRRYAIRRHIVLSR